MIRLSKKMVFLLALAFIFVIGMNAYVLVTGNSSGGQTVGAYVDELRERGCEWVQVDWEEDGSIRVVWMRGRLIFTSGLY
jgi:hypothetical protein